MAQARAVDPMGHQVVTPRVQRQYQPTPQLLSRFHWELRHHCRRRWPNSFVSSAVGLAGLVAVLMVPAEAEWAVVVWLVVEVEDRAVQVDLRPGHCPSVAARQLVSTAFNRAPPDLWQRSAYLSMSCVASQSTIKHGVCSKQQWDRAALSPRASCDLRTRS